MQLNSSVGIQPQQLTERTEALYLQNKVQMQIMERLEFLKPGLNDDEISASFQRWLAHGFSEQFVRLFENNYRAGLRDELVLVKTIMAQLVRE